MQCSSIRNTEMIMVAMDKCELNNSEGRADRRNMTTFHNRAEKIPLVVEGIVITGK